jgi:hypothetical protein
MLYVSYFNKDKDFIKFKFSPSLKIKLHTLSFGVQILKQSCRARKVVQLSFWLHLCSSPRTVIKFVFTKRSLNISKITNQSLGNPLFLPPLALLCFSLQPPLSGHHCHLLLLRFAAVPSTLPPPAAKNPRVLLHRGLILSPRCVLPLPPFLFFHRQQQY